MKRRSDKIANIKEDIFDFTKAIQKKTFHFVETGAYTTLCVTTNWPGLEA